MKKRRNSPISQRNWPRQKIGQSSKNPLYVNFFNCLSDFVGESDSTAAEREKRGNGGEMEKNLHNAAEPGMKRPFYSLFWSNPLSLSLSLSLGLAGA